MAPTCRARASTAKKRAGCGAGALIAAIVVLCSLLFARAIAVEPKLVAAYEPPPKQQAEKRESGQQPPEAPRNAGDATHQREQTQQHFGQRFWDFTLTDVLLAIFTGVLVGVGSWQGVHLKRSVSVANRAADAAQSAAEIAINAARPVLLPRVVSSEPLAPIAQDHDAEPKIAFAFENHGSGVAAITKVTSDVIIECEPLPSVRAFISPREDKRRIVVPGGYKVDIAAESGNLSVFKARVSKHLSQESRSAVYVKSPTKFIYLIGTVYYEDLFGFEYEGGFALLLTRDGQRHGIRGGEAFNYYRYKKKDATPS